MKEAAFLRARINEAITREEQDKVDAFTRQHLKKREEVCALVAEQFNVSAEEIPENGEFDYLIKQLRRSPRNRCETASGDERRTAQSIEWSRGTLTLRPARSLIFGFVILTGFEEMYYGLPGRGSRPFPRWALRRPGMQCW